MKKIATGEVILLENKQKFRFLKVFKNDKLTRASFQNYSLGPYRVSLMLNEKFHREFRNFSGEDLQAAQDKKFTISSFEYSEKFGVSLSVSRRILKSVAKVLIDSNICLEPLNEKGIVYINLCSYAKYLDKGGGLSASFTKEVLPLVAQNAKRYTLYNLTDIVQFKSLFSVRLFELIQGFKYSGWMIKSIDELRVIFNTGPKLQRYTDFKRKTLFKATQEINMHHSYIELRYEEIYNGRRVESIKFLFKPAMKEIGKAIPDMSNIPELPPIPNLKPLDKGEVREKLRLAAERKKRRHQIAAQKQIEAITTSKEEEIALKFLRTGAPLEMVIEATGINRSRVMELQKIVESANYNKSQVKL